MAGSIAAETAAAGTTAATADAAGGPGHTVRSPAAASAAEDGLRTAVHGARFSALQDIAYNAMREQFLSRLGRGLVGTQVLAGTAAVFSAAQLFAATDPVATSAATDSVTVWIALFGAVVGVVLLVLDPAAAAREHRVLRSKYHELLATMDECAEPTMDNVRAWNATMQRIAAGEPPSYRAVKAMAFNAAVNALYREADAAKQRYRVTWRQRWTANWLTHRGTPFPLERPTPAAT